MTCLLRFPELPDSSVPIIQDTMPSPLEYGSRTKMTPHFDAPPKEHRWKEAEVKDGVVQRPEWLKIGFNVAGTKKPLDIEASADNSGSECVFMLSATRNVQFQRQRLTLPFPLSVKVFSSAYPIEPMCIRRLIIIGLELYTDIATAFRSQCATR